MSKLPRSLRTIATKRSTHKHMVFFSDTLLFFPKVPWGYTMSNMAQSFGFSFNDSEERRLTTIFQNKRNQRQYIEQLYNPQFYSNLSSQKQPLEQNQIQQQLEKHYDDWLLNAIRNTLDQVKNFNPGVSSRDYALLCRKIKSKMLNPNSYLVNSNVSQLIHAFNERKIPWGIIANSDPYLNQRLEYRNSRLQIPLYETKAEDSHQPLIINAIDDGYAKPHPKIFNRALSIAKAQYPDIQTTWHIGTQPTVDYVPEKVPIKNILVTETLEKPISDIKHLTTQERRRLKRFRVAEFSELFPVFDIPLSENVVPVLKLLSESAQREYQRSNLWDVLNGDAIKSEQEEEEFTVNNG